MEQRPEIRSFTRTCEYPEIAFKLDTVVDNEGIPKCYANVTHVQRFIPVIVVDGDNDGGGGDSRIVY
jgi:hypothetical protein